MEYVYGLIESTLEMFPDLDPELPIRSLQLSRSFNYHQATETIKQNLEPLLRDEYYYNKENEFGDITKKRFVRPKIIIVAGLPDLHLNREQHSIWSMISEKHGFQSMN